MPTSRLSPRSRSPPPYHCNSETGSVPMSEPGRAATLETDSPSANLSGETNHHHQTIPKTREAYGGDFSSSQRQTFVSRDNGQQSGSNQPARADESQKGTKLARRKRSIQQQLEPSQANPGNNYEMHQQQTSHNDLVNSLSAPKSFFSHISIEPVAFLAIVALYLEFPAIQDLIYTKICLEVVSSHPNLFSQPHTALPSQGQLQNLNSYNSTSQQNDPTTITFDLAQLNSSANANGNRQLPTNGRIQQPTSPVVNINPTTISGDNFGLSPFHNISNQHVICDRVNRTAVPQELLKEILDLNSLFWLKYQILICLVGAISSPYWGGVSDKIGRLVPLNVPIVASVLCNSISLVFGLLISLNSHSLFHINWLYVGALLVGLSGGQMVLIMNAFSFISDNTTSEDRSKRVTVLESVIVVAHSVGFFLGKVIMSLGLAPPSQPWLNRHFVAFAACILLNLACVLLSLTKLRHQKFHKFLNNFEREQQEAAILGADALAGSTDSLGRSSGATKRNKAFQSELLSPAANCSSMDRLRELTSTTPDDPDGPIARSDKSNWSAWDTLVTFSYYKETYQIATKPREARSTILLLLLSGFISALSLAALMSLLFTYVKQDPFNWPTSQYSSWNAITSITRGVALIALTLFMKFVPSWNVPDSLVAGIGFFAKGAGLLMIGLARSSSLIYWSLIAFTLSEYSMPPIRSLLSKLVIKDELCKIYSCLGALQSLCFILGNVAFYVAFNSYMQQDFFRLSFLVVAGIEFGALILMIITHTTIRRQILVT